MPHHSTSRLASRSVTVVAVAVAAMLALTACSAAASTSTSAGNVEADDIQLVRDAMMKDHGLDGLDARAIIDRLDALPTSERPDDLMVSIRPNELTLSDAAQREMTLPMPDDQFYVSIAPYDNVTHECYFHSLTTCKGEIQNGDVHVLVANTDSGEILIDETRTTFDNGFMGLWLPRNIDVNVTIDYDGRSATTDLSTSGDEAATCVTTMQLA